MSYTIPSGIYAKINRERDLQKVIFPEDMGKPYSFWQTILSEEVGEVARAILEGDSKGLKVELVQVAAVAIAFLEEAERNEETNNDEIQ